MTNHPTYPIHTPRLFLRPYQVGDLNDLYEMRSHPEVVRYLYWDVQTVAETKEALETKMALIHFNVEGDTIVLDEFVYALLQEEWRALRDR
jgi:RimJ/RimL family protein N-acetyltransferase